LPSRPHYPVPPVGEAPRRRPAPSRCRGRGRSGGSGDRGRLGIADVLPRTPRRASSRRRSGRPSSTAPPLRRSRSWPQRVPARRRSRPRRRARGRAGGRSLDGAAQLVTDERLERLPPPARPRRAVPTAATRCLTPGGPCTPGAPLAPFAPAGPGGPADPCGPGAPGKTARTSVALQCSLRLGADVHGLDRAVLDVGACDDGRSPSALLKSWRRTMSANQPQAPLRRFSPASVPRNSPRSRFSGCGTNGMSVWTMAKARISGIRISHTLPPRRPLFGSRGERSQSASRTIGQRGSAARATRGWPRARTARSDRR
jgi:hypothetical protein